MQDVDSGRWRLNEKHSYLRRKVFWELFSEDKWRSLALGRPQYFPKQIVSCEIPVDDGEVEKGTIFFRSFIYATA